MEYLGSRRPVLAFPAHPGTMSEELIGSYEPPGLDDDTAAELVRLMEAEVRSHGQDELPERPR